MLFHTFTFAVFFVVVFGAYFALRRQLLPQNLLLIVSSYVFYGWWDARFLSLIALSTVTDYITGLGAGGERVSKTEVGKCALGVAILCAVLAIFATKDARYIIPAMLAYTAFVAAYSWAVQTYAYESRRKWFLGLSVAANIGTLAFFKYFNFFAENLDQLFRSFGWHLDYVTLNIVLPVGLSFYTFQTMSYTIDSYRGVLKPTRALVNLTAFVTFFPQLVAGPIERARELLPQFGRTREITRERLASGAMLFLWGLFKKMVIADNVAPLANRVFLEQGAVTGGEMFIGAVAFMFQIYCDFSAYSDMARGCARALGFDLSLNFNLPYFSRSPSEFWRRWHISLSTWLRDYLYIPLGGNRGGEIATYRNMLLTMTLGGLWHGASWTFVAWGVFHGAILAIYRATGLDALITGTNIRTPSGIAISAVAFGAMLILTLIGWILFRSTSMEQALGIMGGMRWPSATDAGGATLLFYITPLILVQIYQRATGKLEFIAAASPFARFNIILFLLMSLFALASARTEEFIYFDF